MTTNTNVVTQVSSSAGPALVVEVRGSNITAAALEALAIPRGVTRVLFKTDNTVRLASALTPSIFT